MRSACWPARGGAACHGLSGPTAANSAVGAVITSCNPAASGTRSGCLTLNAIFEEMIEALRRGRDVEYPFGRLKRVKRLSERWLSIGDEPMSPYTVEHELGEEGNERPRGSDGLGTGSGGALLAGVQM